MKRKQVAHTQTERRILQDINHPFIVSLRFAFQTSEKLYMVLDYFNGGELFFHLRRYTMYIRIYMQILLHWQTIFHIIWGLQNVPTYMHIYIHTYVYIYFLYTLMSTNEYACTSVPGAFQRTVPNSTRLRSFPHWRVCTRTRLCTGT